MKTWFVSSMLLALVAPCHAERTLAEFDWQKLAASGQPAGGAAVQTEGRSALKVSNTNDTPLSVHLLKIPSPLVTKNLYALVGEVKYEQVRGDGYLEMWNYFSPLKPGMPEGQYFSKTLGDSGEMGKLTGTSDWRKFTLPFNRTGSSGPPTRLELNLHLPGQGTVYLGPIKLVEYNGNQFGPSASTTGAWWSDRVAGCVGGIGGTGLGCLGGLLAWLASRGKSRGLVVGMSWALIGLGGVSAVLGLIALSLQQPYAVWFPLLLLGGLALTILPASLKQFQRHYEELELRRMVSLDATGG